MRETVIHEPGHYFGLGDAAQNLGNGQTWYRLPILVQRSYDNGKWTIGSGGAIALNEAPVSATSVSVAYSSNGRSARC